MYLSSYLIRGDVSKMFGLSKKYILQLKIKNLIRLPTKSIVIYSYILQRCVQMIANIMAVKWNINFRYSLLAIV